METKTSEQKTRGQSFVVYALPRIQTDPGYGAALRRADNPATEYQAWEHLTTWCDLEKPWERLPYATIAAALARAKPVQNGNQRIGRAIAACFDEGNQSDNAKAKLRRLLACENVEEACQVLRPLLSFVASKENTRLNYAVLLDDLLWFGDRVRQRWATDFFAGRKEPA